MISHIVMWKLRDAGAETRAQDVADITAALEGLVGVVPEVAALRVQPNVLHRPGNWHLMLTVEVATEADLEGYLNHPAHVAAAGVIRERTVERVAVDV